MNTVKITRRFEFDAGHRVWQHEGKCRHLHGHRYVLEVQIESDRLNKLGMVKDFAEIKKILGDWIDNNWDHNLLLHPDDELRQVLEPILDRPLFACRFNSGTAYNPTAENMALAFGGYANTLLWQHGVRVTHVRLYETPNCWADWEWEYSG